MCVRETHQKRGLGIWQQKLLLIPVALFTSTHKVLTASIYSSPGPILYILVGVRNLRNLGVVAFIPGEIVHNSYTSMTSMHHCIDILHMYIFVNVRNPPTKERCGRSFSHNPLEEFNAKLMTSKWYCIYTNGSHV